MRKSIQAVIALGLSAMLLGSSGSTFAMWRDDAAINTPAISTGNLQFISNSDITWSVNNQLDMPQQVEPGSTLVGEFSVDVALAGNNLQSNLTATHHFNEDDWIIGSNVSLAFPEGQLEPRSQQIPVKITIELPANYPDNANPVEQSLGTISINLNQLRSGAIGPWQDSIEIRLGTITIAAPALPVDPTPITPELPVLPGTPEPVTPEPITPEIPAAPPESPDATTPEPITPEIPPAPSCPSDYPAWEPAKL